MTNANSNGSLKLSTRNGQKRPKPQGSNALEEGFPFEELHTLAELESWRKEINRPVYHVHKWWATRLGSIFRAIVLAGNLEPDADVWDAFYKPHDFAGRVVLDPFMGSGTTVGEALKLGCKAVGCDINPVSYFLVKKALESCDETALRNAYARLEETVAPKIRRLYRSQYNDVEADILYVFWVMALPCEECETKTRLFHKWIFSSNAYPKKKPESLAVCPCCGEINSVLYTQEAAVCASCAHAFNPQRGPAEGQEFCCEGCGKRHRILDIVRRLGTPPPLEMYALMLLLPDGSKVYKRPDAADRALYAEAEAMLERQELPIPTTEIPPGHNTNQARAYNYRRWRDMFNHRQLLAFGTLLAAILEEPDKNARESLLLLFSGVLEFNNLFCSFKGEGTGAVRPLFHHHILKPERTPLEANPWGTDKSSGAFSTLFERRLLAGKRYNDNPFELKASSVNGKPTGEKVYGVNHPLHPVLARSFDELAEGSADALLLAGDSSCLPIPTASVDLVVTDPPYFDYVHYSELADFFYCWLREGLRGSEPAFAAITTRSAREVQSKDEAEFSKLLGGVLKECARVLKPEGTLAFTFHHARERAWVAVADAICEAGLSVVAIHPVKAEMAVSVPIMQAKEPIHLDLIIVCKPKTEFTAAGEGTSETAIAETQEVIRRYNAAGILLSRGDIRMILMGGILKAGKHSADQEAALFDRLIAATDALHAGQETGEGKIVPLPHIAQLSLLLEKKSQYNGNGVVPAPYAASNTSK